MFFANLNFPPRVTSFTLHWIRRALAALFCCFKSICINLVDIFEQGKQIPYEIEIFVKTPRKRISGSTGSLYSLVYVSKCCNSKASIIATKNGGNLSIFIHSFSFCLQIRQLFENIYISWPTKARNIASVIKTEIQPLHKEGEKHFPRVRSRVLWHKSKGGCSKIVEW